MENSRDTLPQMTDTDAIRNKIYTIRGVQVMLDSDLAEIYQVETRALNQAVKRNQERFPEDFCFQLTSSEYQILKSQIVMSSENQWGGSRRLPFMFTEHGVTMLASLLRSETAIQVSIRIIREFVALRRYIGEHELLSEHLTKIDLKLLEHDKAIGHVLKELESPRAKKAVLFFRGQMFDAFSCIADIIKEADSQIILIDGYTDTATLDLLSKKKDGVKVEIYTSEKHSKLTESEIASFNKEYPVLSVRYTTEFHDRFMILDRKTLFHIGASLKDAGKKAFEISEIDDGKQTEEILRRLQPM